MVYLELTLFVLVITENKLLLFFIISNFSRYLLIKSLHNKDRPANFFSRDNQKKTFEKYTSEKKEMTVFSTNTDLSRRGYICIYIYFRTSFSFLFYNVSKNIEHRVWFLFHYIHLPFCPSTIHKDYYFSVFIFQLFLCALLKVNNRFDILFLILLKNGFVVHLIHFRGNKTYILLLDISRSD